MFCQTAFTYPIHPIRLRTKTPLQNAAISPKTRPLRLQPTRIPKMTATSPRKTSTNTSNSTSTPTFTWLETWYPAAWIFDMPSTPLYLTLWQRPYSLSLDPSTQTPVATNLQTNTIHPTSTNTLGLVFIWPGTNHTLAKSTPAPLPPTLQNIPISRLTSYRHMRRIFPFSAASSHENLTDPAHVPWSHHGVLDLTARRVARNLGLDIWTHHDPATPSAPFVVAGQRLPTPGRYKVTWAFQAPYRAWVTVQIPVLNVLLNVLTWTSPVSHDENTLFGCNVVVDAHIPFKLLTGLTPRWYGHTIFNAILDGDAYLIHGQEDNVQQVERDGYGGAWRKKYTLAAGSWDALVIRYRQFLDKHSDSMPYLTTRPTHPYRKVSRGVVNDRWRYHTIDCPCCKPALRNIRRLECMAWVGAGVAGLVSAFAALATVAITKAEIRLCARTVHTAGLAGVIGFVVFALAGRVLGHWKQLLTYTDVAYDLAHSR